MFPFLNDWAPSVQKTAKTANFTLDPKLGQFVKIDATAGAVTVTLPDLGAEGLTNVGQERDDTTNVVQAIFITKVDASANNVVIARAGTNTIRGAATSITRNTRWEVIVLVPSTLGATGDWLWFVLKDT